MLINPVSKESQSKIPFVNPQSCFIMRQLGGEMINPLPKIIRDVEKILKIYALKPITAKDSITGKDFLCKIWELMTSVQIGIAILTKDAPESTINNIYYELGMMDAMGKNTIVVKSDDYEISSDLIRTEYINFDKDFKNNFKKYLDNIIKNINDFYIDMAKATKSNISLSLDYTLKSYLITGDSVILKQGENLFKKNSNNLDPYIKTLYSGIFNDKK